MCLTFRCMRRMFFCRRCIASSIPSMRTSTASIIEWDMCTNSSTFLAASCNGVILYHLIECALYEPRPSSSGTRAPTPQRFLRRPAMELSRPFNSMTHQLNRLGNIWTTSIIEWDMCTNSSTFVAASYNVVILDHLIQWHDQSFVLAIYAPHMSSTFLVASCNEMV